MAQVISGKPFTAEARRARSQYLPQRTLIDDELDFAARGMQDIPAEVFSARSEVAKAVVVVYEEFKRGNWRIRAECSAPRGSEGVSNPAHRRGDRAA